MTNYGLSKDVIIACSTASNVKSAIGIIRISGNFDLLILQPLFSANLRNVIERNVFHSRLLDKDLVLDDALCTFFQNPKSYTGENVLELSVHGNPINISKIINVFVDRFGFRLAKPGEFTQRALFNKKLNLCQVEGLDLLLNANSGLVFNNGLRSLLSELSDQYRLLYEYYNQVRTDLEILIDFSEDIGEENSLKNFENNFIKLHAHVENLRHKCVFSPDALLNPKISLFGPVNAGKSSLFNQLIGSKRSIVSSMEGTTRDFISENLNFEQANFQLIDTAGLRDTPGDIVEAEGIKRTKEILVKSFFKILVISKEQYFSEVYREFYSIADLIVISHCDLDLDSNKKIEISGKKYLLIGFGSIGPQGQNSGSIGPQNQFSGPIGPIDNSFNFYGGSIGPISLDITTCILKIVSSRLAQVFANNPILINRQVDVITSIYADISEIKNIYKTGDVGLISNEINNIGSLIKELIGIVPSEDILNNIFDNFCIGK